MSEPSYHGMQIMVRGYGFPPIGVSDDWVRARIDGLQIEIDGKILLLVTIVEGRRAGLKVGRAPYNLYLPIDELFGEPS